MREEKHSMQLRCGLSDYVIFKGERLGVIFDQFLNFALNITAICRSTQFYIRNIGKNRNLLSKWMLVLLLVVDLIIVIPSCIRSLRIQRITPVQKNLHWL